jgi:prepilin signal peptidase PulO-like enzyme (type II secretory pathway)
MELLAMTMGSLFGALLMGWLAGGLANWAADQLPGQTWRQAIDWEPRVLPHFWTLWWYPWRAGRCPHCGQVRSWRLPGVEGAMMALFAGTLHFVDAGTPITSVVGVLWLYGGFLLTVLVIDLEHRRVLNRMTGPAALVVLLLSLTPWTLAPGPTLVGGLVGLGIFLVIAIVGRGAMGMGDVKLAGVIGLMTGYPHVLSALTLGIVLGGVAALALLISRRATRKSTMAYAPYLAAAALITLWTAQ